MAIALLKPKQLNGLSPDLSDITCGLARYDKIIFISDIPYIRGMHRSP